RMIEVSEIGEAMDLDPFDRLAGGGAFAYERQPRIILEHLVVAIHAGRTGGNVRIPGFLDGIVTVAAIDPELVGVSGVGKTDGLNRLIANFGVFGSEV